MLAPNKPTRTQAPHRCECQDCGGSGRENRNLCCGGQGCRTCDIACITCEGIGTLVGYISCDGELVTIEEASRLHDDREDSACPIEECEWCAREMADARAMYGGHAAPTREQYRDDMIAAGRGHLLRDNER